jgi:peptidoglycan/xylan/chitin deacetylase (PgdA/CDA1 family)
MLKHAKLTVLRAADAAGVSALTARSAWRRRRLLILCYHGVALYDEHLWSGLYVSREFFRRRMALVRDAGCSVLPLEEALDRLGDGSLPPRAVTITFDDGFHDFHRAALPVVESFGYPATLYLTTYYVEYQRPVFDPMCSYLLWKANGRRLDWPEVLGGGVALDEAGRQDAERRIREFALSRRLTGAAKDELLRRLAGRLGLDYEDLCRRRVFHLMTAEEARDVAERGVRIEMHTHRHRVYRSRRRMFAELDENRRRIEAITGATPRHFCYTGGFYLPEHVEQLRAYGIRSAVTCRPGVCAAGEDRLQLPRLVDTAAMPEVEFRSWLAGTAAWLPHRRHQVSEGQLVEEEAAEG